MRKRIIALLAVTAFTVAGWAAGQAPRKPVMDYHIKKLGVNKFVKIADYRKVKTFADFAAIAVEKYAQDIQTGLTQLESAEIYEGLMAYLKNSAASTEGEIPYGTTLDWMFYRKNGIVRTMAKPVWEGKDASGQPYGIPAYLFEFCFQGNKYYMAVPKACLNVSLLKKEPYVSSCNMTIKMLGECATVGETVAVDLNESQGLSNIKISVSPEGAQINANGELAWNVVFASPGEYTITAEGQACDGQIVTCKSETIKVVPALELQVAVDPSCNVTRKPVTIKATATAGTLAKVTVKDENGAVVLQQDNPIGPITFTSKHPGVFHVEAVANGECNQTKTAMGDIRFEKPILSPFYLIAEAGVMMAKGTYSAYLYPRFGAGVWLSENLLSLELLPGAGLSLGGEAFHNFLMIDARLALHPGQAYLAAGIGLSGKVRDAEPGLDTGVWESDFDLSFAAGYYLTAARNMAVIGEFRMPIGEDMPIKYNHAFQLGFRYLFPINSGKNPCEQK